MLFNVYLPCDQKRIASLAQFSSACSSVKNLVKDIEKRGYKWLFIFDSNCGVLNQSKHANLVLDSLPNNYQIIEKDLIYRYINSGTLTNIDHCICINAISCSILRVDKDEHDYDNLPLAITLFVNQTSRYLVGTSTKSWYY